jgi:xylulokinase
MAFNNTGAGGLEWYQRHFAPQMDIPALLELAARVPPGSEGLMARPMIYQYAPADGFFEHSGPRSHGHCVRAILEATAAALAGLVEQLAAEERPGRILATGGGARSPLWMQIKADLLGMEVIRAQGEELACQGAAMLAARAAGWFDSLEAASESWIHARNRYAPDARSQAEYARWLALYRQAAESGDTHAS